MSELPQAMVEFLLAEIPAPDELQDDDLTAHRAAKVWKISPRAASTTLNKMVADGKMTRVEKINMSSSNRHRVAVYVMVVKKK